MRQTGTSQARPSQVLSAKAAHGAVADRLAMLGRDTDVLTDDAVASLVLHAAGRLDRLHSLLTAALFLGSMDSVARIGCDYVQKALAMEAAAAPVDRAAPLRAEPRDAWAPRSGKPRRPGRRFTGAVVAAVIAGCLTVPQQWQSETRASFDQDDRPAAPQERTPPPLVMPGPVPVPPDKAQAAPSPGRDAPQPAPPIVQLPPAEPAPQAEAPEAPRSAPRPPAEAGMAALADPAAIPPPVLHGPAAPAQEAAPRDAPATTEPRTLAGPGRAEQPEAPVPAAAAGLAQPPQALRGGSGLLLLAQSGDTLPRLYQQVYRGVRPPPYAEFVAANPSVIRPGTLLLFPTPPDGWAQR